MKNILVNDTNIWSKSYKLLINTSISRSAKLLAFYILCNGFTSMNDSNLIHNIKWSITSKELNICLSQLHLVKNELVNVGFMIIHKINKRDFYLEIVDCDFNVYPMEVDSNTESDND